MPAHLADMAAFTLATGLRRANVTGLLWSQVDMVRRMAWIHPDQAKARKAIAVPLNADAVTIIRRWLGRHETHVFWFRGKPLTRVSTKGWYEALERAQIHDFRWHDLRHTLASWHVQCGTPLYALQEMGGKSGYGAALRALHGRARCFIRGSPVRFAGSGQSDASCQRHVYGTAVKEKGPASLHALE